jgi:hypothetical protein
MALPAGVPDLCDRLWQGQTHWCNQVREVAPAMHSKFTLMTGGTGLRLTKPLHDRHVPC